MAIFGERPIEIAAVTLGLINITLLVRRSIWNYPFGIVMVTLYAWIFYDAKLYSEVGLQVFFFAIQIYGWVQWHRARDNTGLVVVRRMSEKQMLVYGASIAVGTLALGSFMSRITDTSFPYWDGSIAVLSVAAQILLARRRLENWILWIIVDILAIGLFATKGLWPTAILYGIFLAMAVAGFLSWRKSYAAQQNN